MVSLGDDNGGNNDPIKPDSPFVTSDQPFDTSDGETQLFDSQSWSPEYIGNQVVAFVLNSRFLASILQ
ncbi:hypothetical protein L484_023567 [Morus notabilis]|uniref:Uncharacterized protein n=1 Tax=Morus notabilis TaxID=981085 RepID=W9R6T2_9ROSA|nr:hypothetical protein L484_023567 [Morus notabilis]